MNPALGLTTVVLGVVAAVAVVIVLRRSRRISVQQTAAGPEVISTRGNRRPEPRPQEAPRAPVARLGRGKRRPDKAPVRRSVADPRLTGPVILEAAWSQSVYHGCGAGEGFKVAVRAATARGRSHAYNGDPGQDAAGVAWCEHRHSIFLVVADGLGSKPNSGQVAHEIVEEVITRAAELHASDDPARMLAHAVVTVERTVRLRELDGASTLVAAEIGVDRDGCRVVTWGIGDSEAWVLADGTWRLLHHERRSDTENITRHLPGHREMQTRHARVPRGAVVTLASDGFASALGDNSPVARDLSDRWRKPPAPLEFLSQVNFDDPYFNDDRAAVAVWIQ